ncbi:hypothetical protein BDA96_10G252400 [Sorghum bicolor]|uniref:Uncharacterized protein n=1 Tax=Sorghum bicolor TaxID=4558 RepID=A0A921U215_SORBI|nr:hypothetical protein BDA96_10G252400 [Sorghum bicolor]
MCIIISQNFHYNSSFTNKTFYGHVCRKPEINKGTTEVAWHGLQLYRVSVIILIFQDFYQFYQKVF